jgi:signal transduction histidine kinase
VAFCHPLFKKMTIIFDPINIALLTTAIFNSVLAAIIYFSSGKSRYAKVYAGHIIAIIVWVAAMALYRSSPPETAMLFSKILYIAPTFIASIFFLFTCIFPYKDKFHFKKQVAAVFAWNLVVAVMIAAPGLTIKDVLVVPGEEKKLLFTNWYIVYFLYTLVVFTLAYSKLFWKYFRTEKKAKAQTLYILIGHFLSSNLAFVTNLTLPWMGIYKFNWLGQVFTFIMLVMTTYAIIAHRLMDIKLVIKQWGVRFFSMFVIVVSVVSAKVIITNLWRELAVWGDFVVVILAAISYPYINKAASYAANRYFFYSLYDMDKVVPKINKKLASSIDQTEVYDFIYKTFVDIFHFRSFMILKKEKGTRYSAVYARGFKALKGEEALIDKSLEEDCTINGEILDEENLRGYRLMMSLGKHRANILERQVEILLPLTTKRGLVGMMLFGPKESGDMYSEGDFKLLYVVGSQLASAMENVELYARISSLNKNLEKKVLKQTREIKAKAIELEAKNQNLEKLLQIKNEFLRVVNHQLNTPISIIKNSVFMVRKKSFTMEKGLTFIEEGTRRMEGVLSDFWRAFSVEGEGVKMNASKVDIEVLAGKLVEDASSLETVKSGKVKVLLVKPRKLPKAKTDPVQVSQVMSNLLDNAISYTPSGTIKVKLEHHGKFIKVHISDTGQGIDKKDISNLFEKFYRTERAKKFRPGGSGLGLYIAKRIVEAGGGQLKLEKSEVGKGSTFSFTVPIWK